MPTAQPCNSVYLASYLAEDLIDFALMDVKRNMIEDEQQIYRVPSKDDLNRYFRGSNSGYRHHKGSFTQYDPKTSWCGLFVAYCLNAVGANVRWIIGEGLDDPTGGNIFQKIGGNKGILRGDICVRGASGHHFIVIDPTETDQGPKGVEGNSGGLIQPQLCYGRRVQNRFADVKLYYRLS